jgi:acyl-CoA hydrolase
MHLMPVRVTPENISSLLPRRGLTFVQGCSAESVLLADALCERGTEMGAMNVTGIFVPGLNRTNWLANPDCRIETFFMTPELKRMTGAVTFLPYCYSDISSHFARADISAAIFMVSPPDHAGICSFGPVVDFLADLWPRIPVKIAHINPTMPSTMGHKGIPYRELTAVIERDAPLLSAGDEPDEQVATDIGRHIAAMIPDHATIQTGLGKIPGATLRALTMHRNLKIHSGLIGDAVLDLAAAGALAPGPAVTAGVAIGSARLYEAIADPLFEFRPVSYTHALPVIALLKNFYTVNSALCVDLFGQVYAEWTPKGLMSGPGGALEFARGAKAANGVRIIALPAGAANDRSSRIVLPSDALGPVSLGRMDVDIVVTEYGAADLRGLDYTNRARALIAIAAPAFKDGLSGGWHNLSKSF